MAELIQGSRVRLTDDGIEGLHNCKLSKEKIKESGCLVVIHVSPLNTSFEQGSPPKKMIVAENELGRFYITEQDIEEVYTVDDLRQQTDGVECRKDAGVIRCKMAD